MKSSMTRSAVIIGFGLALMMPAKTAFAGPPSFQHLSAEWWQWALSIPASPIPGTRNPLLDRTGASCMIGQRGPVWFLAGNFLGGTTVRTCEVPEGKVLFFPVINQVNIDTPNVCGQGADRIPIADLRALSAEFISGATNLLVELDGEPVSNVQRVQSPVFEVALPERNIFDPLCRRFGGVPAGIYSPAVDDGFYASVGPLEVGNHTLRIHSENPSAGFFLDVTYHLTVVPVVLE